MCERYMIGASGRTFRMSGMRPGIWGSSVQFQNDDSTSEYDSRTRIRTNERDVDAPRCERAALSRPTQTILENPGVKVIFGFLGEPKVGPSNALQYVMVVLGCSEDAWGRVRNVPVTGRVGLIGSWEEVGGTMSVEG